MRNRTPETLIANLRKRRRRMLSLGIVGAGFVACAALSMWIGYDMMQQLVPEESDDLLLHLAMAQALQPMLAATITRAYLFTAVGSGMLAVAFIEWFSYTKNELLVEMWDQLQTLRRDTPSVD